MGNLRDYIVETFRSGYCERYIIQARSIEKAEKIAKNDFGIDTDIDTGNGYFVF